MLDYLTYEQTKTPMYHTKYPCGKSLPPQHYIPTLNPELFAMLSSYT